MRLEERVKRLEAEIQEILQRIRNKGKILVHPKEMPKLPLENANELARMEKCLHKQANQEFLVCTDKVM